jgi:hypothetical protein
VGRIKLRVADWRPSKPLTHYHHKPVGSSIKEPRRTVASGGHNPFHEGLFEAMRAGARKSKKVCRDRATNGVPHFEEVCSDNTVRSDERERVKQEGYLGKLDRKTDVELAMQARKHDKEKYHHG